MKLFSAEIRLLLKKGKWQILGVDAENQPCEYAGHGELTGIGRAPELFDLYGEAQDILDALVKVGVATLASPYLQEIMNVMVTPYGDDKFVLTAESVSGQTVYWDGTGFLASEEDAKIIALEDLPSVINEALGLRRVSY